MTTMDSSALESHIEDVGLAYVKVYATARVNEKTPFAFDSNMYYDEGETPSPQTTASYFSDFMKQMAPGVYTLRGHKKASPGKSIVSIKFNHHQSDFGVNGMPGKMGIPSMYGPPKGYISEEEVQRRIDKALKDKETEDLIESLKHTIDEYSELLEKAIEGQNAFVNKAIPFVGALAQGFGWKFDPSAISGLSTHAQQNMKVIQRAGELKSGQEKDQAHEFMVDTNESNHESDESEVDQEVNQRLLSGVQAIADKAGDSTPDIIEKVSSFSPKFLEAIINSSPQELKTLELMVLASKK